MSLSSIKIVEPSAMGLNPKKLDEMSSSIRRYINQKQLAGAVTLVSRQGKLVHFQAQGHSYIETHTPMSEDAIFRIASMTKPITSTALMMLYEKGAFGLDDPLSAWMPEYEEMMVSPRQTGGIKGSGLELVPAARQSPSNTF